MTYAIAITIKLSGMNRRKRLQLKIPHAANFIVANVIHRRSVIHHIRKSINLQASSFSDAHRAVKYKSTRVASSLAVQAHRRLSVNVNGVTFDRETGSSLIVIGIERGRRLVEPSVVR